MNYPEDSHCQSPHFYRYCVRRWWIIALVQFGLGLLAAHATDGTWTGGTGSYSTSTNWSGGIVASGTGATATINTPGSITVDANVTLGAITGAFSNGTSLILTGTSGQSLKFAASSTPTLILSNWFSRYDYLSSINLSGTQGLTYTGKSNVLVLKSGVTWAGFSGAFTIAPNSDGSMVYAQAAGTLPPVDLTMTPGSSTGGYGNTKLVINAGADQTIGALNSTNSGSNSTYISSYSGSGALTGGSPTGTNTNGYSTLTIGTTNTSGTFQGNIGVAYLNSTKTEDTSACLLHLIKTGTGTQVFGGRMYYSGTTTVNGGSLIISGTHAAVVTGSDSGAYLVGANAILGGTGTIKPASAAGSSAMVSISGTLAPGFGGTGTLSFDGANSVKPLIAFGVGAVVAIDLGASGAGDKVSILNAQSGDVSFNSTVVNFNDPTAGSLTSGTYVLFHSDASAAYSGLTIDGSNGITAGLSIGTGLANYPGSSLKISGNDIILALAPSSVAGTPSGVSVAISGTQVTLSWTASANATSYVIYRSTTPNGNFAAIGTTSSTSYVDPSVANGATYYYKVSASNGVVESPVSSAVVATPTNLNTLSVVGVHLRAYSTYGMAVSDTAGVIHAPYWNNLVGPQIQGETTSLSSLTDQNGNLVSGLAVAWTAGSTTTNSYSNTGTIKTGSDAVTIPPAVGDPNLFASVFDQFNGTASTLSVTGIPYSSYDVLFYVYDGGSSRGGSITLGSTTYFIRGGAGTPVASGSGYVQSDDTSLGAGSDVTQGNYVRFAAVTGSSFNASFVAQNLGDSTQRLKIAGFQILSNDPVGVPTQALNAPTALNANASNQQVGLNWAASPTASYYKVYRGTTSGTYSLLSSGTVFAPLTSFADTSVSNGTMYYYAVTAVNSAGESLKSGEASAVPLKPSFTEDARTVYQWSLPMAPIFSGTSGAWPYDPQRRAYLWIPPTCAKVQGVMVGLHNMLEKPMFDDPAIRQACADANLAILFIAPGDAKIWTPNGVGNYTAGAASTAIHLDPSAYYSQDISSGTTHYATDINPATGQRFANQSEQAGAELAALLTQFATLSGYSELQYAPVLLTDHSAGSPFCWTSNVPTSAAMVGRIFAILPNKGVFPGNLTAVNSVTGVSLQGIPIFHVTSEYQEISDWGNTWELGDAPAMRGLRAGGTGCLIGECVQPGTGHYEYAPEQVTPLANFIRAAAAARIPANWSATSSPTLKSIDPTIGWVIDTRYMGSGTCQTVSYASWVAAGNDPLRAYWYLDQTTAQSVCDAADAGFSKKPQMLNAFTNSSMTSLYSLGTQSAGYATYAPSLLADGATFQVRACSVTQSPIARLHNGNPLGIPTGSILFRANGSGSLKQTGADTFRVWLERESVARGGQPWEPFILAYHPGDSNYRSAYRPIQVNTAVAVNLISGSAQTVTFPALPNVTGVSSLPQINLSGSLAATASSGLPVQYWVASGPYRTSGFNGEILIPDQIPPGTKFPMPVVIGAWQWGRPSSVGTAIQSATPVFQTFYINPSGLESWRNSYFGTYSNAGLAADSASPAGDEIDNLMKYAVGMSPLVHSATSPATVASAVSNGASYLTLTFNRISDPLLTYSVEASNDLSPGSWTPIWSSTGSANDPSVNPVTVQDSVSRDQQPKRFLRLRVSY